MAYCGKCLHLDVCKTADSCDGHVPRCKHFMDKDGMALASCKLGAKGCFTDGKCRYKKACENKVITRVDQIRAMTDEELARFLLEADEGNLTVDVCDEKYCTPERCPNDCTNAIIKWLQAQVEEGAT
ncbi:MAG: hypothetical protein E7468_01350 [Ruminococcaceae bacterium]|nr:hypothetical protein [Oscillospiraceae bacterium]